MAPDNRVVRGTGAFSVQLPYSSTFTVTLGVSQTTQDQAFIPLTSNSALTLAGGLHANDLAALPAQSLNGKVMTVVQDYRLVGRPLPKLYGTLRIREEKLDDQTPSLSFLTGYSPADQSITLPSVKSPAPESEAWSRRNDVYGLDADYSINRYVDVSLLVERRTRVHPEPREVPRDGENVFGGGVRARPLDNLNVTANYKYGQRKMDSFDVTTYDDGSGALAERAFLRRFDIADRNQSVFNGAATWSPSEKLDLTFSGWWNKDNYKNSLIGLQSVQNTQVFGEAGVHPSSIVDLSGGFGYGQMKSTQAGGEGTFYTDVTKGLPWTSNVDDKNVYAFAHASWWAQPKKVQLATQYTFTRDLQVNALSQPADPVKALDLPPGFYRTHDVSVEAHWYYTAGLEFGCRYDYVQYDVNDWLAQSIPYVNVNPSLAVPTSAAGFFLGNNKLSYTANMVQVFATRRF